jgi:hypothetical protein
MAGSLVCLVAGEVLKGIRVRSNISRSALWRQDEHWKIRRSIPNGVVVSARMSIRRISAPHARHFITLPQNPVADEALIVTKTVPTVWWRRTAGMVQGERHC